MPILKRIILYPIKSLDGCEVSAATVLPTGALVGDRRYALIDDEGKYVNGKRFAKIHRIRATYDKEIENVTLSTSETKATFSLQQEGTAIAAWCSKVLGVACRWVENSKQGHPDDFDANGPTLISTSTLAEICTWYNAFNVDELRRRLRTNLEIEAEPAFWEDRLVGLPDQSKRFSIGKTLWRGNGICQRCAVPTRDSQTGSTISGFAREFSHRRQTSLPEWSPTELFDHYYRVAINSVLDSLNCGNVIQRGDSVQLTEENVLEH